MITVEEKSKFWGYQNNMLMAVWLPTLLASLFHWDPLTIPRDKDQAAATKV